MKKLTNKLVYITGLMISTLLLISCSEPNNDNGDTETTANQEVVEEETPMLEAASEEYADIVKEQFDLLSNFDFDAFGNHLADDVKWYWPDGNADSRTTISGKENLINWWKEWKETSGAQSLSFTNHSLLPLKINEGNNYYNVKGTGVLAYNDINLTLGEKSNSTRQHVVFMFNDNKKITHAFLYYDRTGFAEITDVELSQSDE
ncbi:nuclear transport factor 2 family protein [Mangrovivirga sp. M17]|uniref:Nuclear transport factor 2 family protein n=1 Tax=Mangrovivirga halotolerans TaxID=2993936 RepID=A0ABT3RV67_9BACT|nr:nuclear transport factor 2 family protein [Mangrovivirga halotolerans]MCX2745530.1 nuclear transport factor 2 family protein [Mangrovivirga halotolerans]